APAMPGGFAGRLKAIGAALAMPAVALPIAANALLSFVLSGFESTFLLWTEREFGWGPRSNGYLLAYIGLVLVLVQGGLVSRLSARFGETRVALMGAAAFAVGLAASPLAALLLPGATLAFVVAGSALVAVGLGLGQPALHSLTSRGAPADRRGAVLGAGQSCQSLARIGGPVFAGVLFAEYGRHVPYLAGAAIVALAI